VPERWRQHVPLGRGWPGRWLGRGLRRGLPTLVLITCLVTPVLYAGSDESLDFVAEYLRSAGFEEVGHLRVLEGPLTLRPLAWEPMAASVALVEPYAEQLHSYADLPTICPLFPSPSWSTFPFMDYQRDTRTVMTLDAGGTTLAFTAVQGTDEVIEPIVLPSPGDDLEQTLQSIIRGFVEVRSALSQDPVAISFSFPGPADYALGIIDDLENMPAFRGGVALGPMLEDEFGIPVFISNDGDLFAYGEAIAGLLPEINELLKEKGSPKRYRNLLGATFGTGFGGGIVSNGHLFTGDNSAAGEINRSRNRLLPECSLEESVSVHAVRRVYAREAGLKLEDAPCPFSEGDLRDRQRRAWRG